jgi:hypothetical protein
MPYNFRLKIILALAVILFFLFLVLCLNPAPKPKTEAPAIYTPPPANQILPAQVLLSVPFTSQAPFGNWNDPRQDSGCEEASILMAMLWVKGQQSITPEEAEKEIIAISEFEQKNYGFFHDTSTQDTLMVLKNYFGYEKAFAVFDINIKDIKAELARGNLVIVPIDGTVIDNIYYTPPGPTRHKIVITGYNDATQEFITNDPGTKNGNGYRYDYQILENSLMDYPTGFNESVNQIKKSMIVVQK